jgi:hypothetical protein
MSAKQYTVLILVVIGSSVLSSLVISKGLLGPGKIRASEVEVVDEHGKTRASLDALGTLRLKDDQGHDRLVLSCFGSPRMQCLSSSGGTLVELNAAEGGKMALEFNDSAGKTSARIGVNQGTPERPRLEVFKSGEPLWTVPEK